MSTACLVMSIRRSSYLNIMKVVKVWDVVDYRDYCSLSC